MRDLAVEVGITERAVHRIIAELAEEGYIAIVRDGRCNKYTTYGDQHLRHPIESHRQVADLLRLIEDKSSTAAEPKRRQSKESQRAQKKKKK